MKKSIMWIFARFLLTIFSTLISPLSLYAAPAFKEAFDIKQTLSQPDINTNDAVKSTATSTTTTMTCFISGQVLYSEDSTPVAGMTVYTDKGEYSAVTNYGGGYLILDVVPDDYILTALGTGCLAQSQAVTVNEGTSATAIFNMKPLADETGAIAGRVISRADGSGIDNVPVYCESYQILTKTSTVNGVTGYYTFENLIPDNHIIMASATGYKTATQTVTVVEYETTMSDFSLQSESCEASITANPTVLTLQKNTSGTVTVTVIGVDCYPVEGNIVRARIDKSERELIKVSPKKQETDENGHAVFTIRAKDKTGSASVKFMDKGSSLSTQVDVTVSE